MSTGDDATIQGLATGSVQLCVRVDELRAYSTVGFRKLIDLANKLGLQAGIIVNGASVWAVYSRDDNSGLAPSADQADSALPANGGYVVLCLSWATSPANPSHRSALGVLNGAELAAAAAAWASTWPTGSGTGVLEIENASEDLIVQWIAVWDIELAGAARFATPTLGTAGLRIAYGLEDPATADDDDQTPADSPISYPAGSVWSSGGAPDPAPAGGPAPTFTSPTADQAFSGAQGATVNVPVTIVRDGATGDITITPSSLPTGATASPLVLTGTATTGTLTITLSGSATPVTADPVTLTMTGTGFSPVARQILLTITAAGVEAVSQNVLWRMRPMF
jgi:hypothetical protein